MRISGINNGKKGKGMSIKKSLLASTTLGVSIAWALPAASQEVTGVQEVVVTGTRVGAQGFDTPTPTQVLSTEMLQQRGATNVGDFLNELPAFRPSTNSQVRTNASTGQASQVFADLRALGSIRTLTLIDGRRVVPSSATGQVDLNLVPTVLVDRIDVVTGGVSAVYGSDALAGVVNHSRKKP